MSFKSEVSTIKSIQLVSFSSYDCKLHHLIFLFLRNFFMLMSTIQCHEKWLSMTPQQAISKRHSHWHEKSCGPFSLQKKILRLFFKCASKSDWNGIFSRMNRDKKVSPLFLSRDFFGSRGYIKLKIYILSVPLSFLKLTDFCRRC